MARYYNLTILCGWSEEDILNKTKEAVS